MSHWGGEEKSHASPRHMQRSLNLGLRHAIPVTGEIHPRALFLLIVVISRGQLFLGYLGGIVKSWLTSHSQYDLHIDVCMLHVTKFV